MQPGNRRAQRGATRRRHVMRVAGLQALNGPLDHRRRRAQIRIPDAQNEYVFATFAGGDGLVVSAPGISTGVFDAAHERGKVHVITVRGQC